MDREENDRRVVLVLALINNWYRLQCDDPDAPGNPLVPRRIDAVAGLFDAPTEASNDYVAGAALFAFFFCAKYRANSSFFDANGYKLKKQPCIPLSPVLSHFFPLFLFSLAVTDSVLPPS